MGARTFTQIFYHIGTKSQSIQNKKRPCSDDGSRGEQIKYKKAKLVLAALALMAFAVAATALTITMTAAAFTVAMTTAALMLATVVLTIAVAIIAIAATATAARAAYLLIHGVSHLLIRGSAALLDSNAEVLIHRGKEFIQLLTSLKKALADGVVNHILTQAIKGSDFLIRGGHTLHVLIAQLLAILIHLAEEISSLGVLVKKTDTGPGGNDLLTLSEGVGQLGSNLNKFRSKRCI